MFGEASAGRGAGAEIRLRGGDRYYRMHVDFLDAVNGATRRLRTPEGSMLEVRIPAGHEDGQVLHLEGQGSPDVNGGRPGDALVEIRVKPHPLFRRVGNDIHLDMPVALPQAVLGGTITVPTRSGSVSMRVLAGRSSSTGSPRIGCVPTIGTSAARARAGSMRSTWPGFGSFSICAVCASMTRRCRPFSDCSTRSTSSAGGRDFWGRRCLSSRLRAARHPRPPRRATRRLMKRSAVPVMSKTGSAPQGLQAIGSVRLSETMNRRIARNWIAWGLRALAAALFLLCLLVLPPSTLATLILLCGAYVVADGVFAIVAGSWAARRGERWWTVMLEGAMNLAAVGAVLIWPVVLVAPFTRVASIWAVVTDALMVAATRRLSALNGRRILMAAGLLSIAWGLLLRWRDRHRRTIWT